MTPEKAYQLYFAIKLHFTTQYDVFEYGTNFNNKNKVQEKNDFKLIYDIIKHVESEREMVELCVSNFLYGLENMLFYPEHAVDNYTHWLSVKQSLDYRLQSDLSVIEFNLLKSNNTFDAYLGKNLLSDLISHVVDYESIILLDMKIPVIDKIGGFNSPKYKVRMHKAKQFVNKGVLSGVHVCHIDNFLSNIK